MRRSSIPFLGFCIALLSASAVQADLLYNDISIKVTGTYSQTTTDAPEGTLAVTKPLKMADILALLGITDVDPATVKFYWNADAFSYVIAPIGIEDGTDTTFLGTFLQFTDDDVTLNKTVKKSFAAGAVRLLNGELNGSYSATYSFSRTKATDVSAIVGYGAINGKDTILKATLRDVYLLDF